MMTRKHTTETRQKMSDAQRERWANMSQEKRDAIRRKMSDTKIKKENALKWLKYYNILVYHYMQVENKVREPHFNAIPKLRIDATPILAL